MLSLNTELENDSIAYESTHRRDGREIFNMDWLDSLEFKEEHQETEDTGYPEKDSERKRKHNQGEKGRGERMRTNQSSKFFFYHVVNLLEERNGLLALEWPGWMADLFSPA